MLTHADKTRDSTSQPGANSVSQRFGGSAFQFVGNRPEAIAQRKQQERANNSPRVKQLRAFQEMANHHSATPEQPVQRSAGNGEESGNVVQRVEREAQVTWATTHLVQVQGESLFGKGGDWQSREVPSDALGELSQGQLIIVDDEEVFMSRRGANQEDPSRRKQDEVADELKYKWLRVLFVESDGKLKPAPEDAYVRAETIKLADIEKPPFRGMYLEPHSSKDSQDEGIVSKDLEGIHEAWEEAALKRRRSVDRVKEVPEDDYEITSGWNWDQYDEGENVSEDMQDPATLKKVDDPRILRNQAILSANYTGGVEREPIAYMVLEVRDEGSGPFMYIRWLIAHPEKGGGGSMLVKEAIRRFKAQEECTELRVDSAFSAVGWYEKLGFEKVHPEKIAVKKGVGYTDTELVMRKK